VLLLKDEEKVALWSASAKSSTRTYNVALAFVLESRRTVALHACHMKA